MESYFHQVHSSFIIRMKLYRHFLFSGHAVAHIDQRNLKDVNIFRVSKNQLFSVDLQITEIPAAARVHFLRYVWEKLFQLFKV